MTTNEAVRAIEILLVEDNLGDIRLTQEALKHGKLHNHLSVVRNGEEALKFLRRIGEHADVPRPDLILLDLNLPRVSGREVLAEIKSDQNLKRIPVVILTTATSDEDIMQSYDLSANCYINKPVDMTEFVKVVQSIEDFWFAVVTLAPQ